MIDTNFHSWCIFQPPNLSKPPKDKNIIQKLCAKLIFLMHAKGNDNADLAAVTQNLPRFAVNDSV